MGPIAIAFGVLHLKGGSAGELGLVLGSSMLGMVICTPFGGVIADKFGRIRMVVFADIWGSLGLLMQAGFFATGHVPLWVMLVANINFGLMAGIWYPAFSGALPAVVPDEALQRANGITAFVSNGAMITGAAFSGILISAYGATAALFVDAITFTISGLILMPMIHLNPARDQSAASPLDDFKYGWKVFLSYPWIVIVVIGSSFWVMSWAMAENVIGPLISLREFNGAKSWAIVITCESIGYLIGSLVGYKIKVKYPMRFLMIITWSLSIYIWTLVSPQKLWVIAASAMVWGVALELWGTLWNTAMARQVPRDVLSRVSAFDWLGTNLCRPLGLLLAGPVMAWLGTRRALEVLTIFTAAIVALVLLSKDVRNMEMPTSTLSNQ